MRVAVLPAVAPMLMAIAAMPASAAEPLSDWKIEPSDARCVAARQYGTPDKPITLALKAPASEVDVLQLAIIRPGYRKSADQSGAKLTIDGQEFNTYVLGYPLAGPKKQTASLFTLQPAVSAALRKATNFAVSVKGGVREGFTFGPSAGLWTGLNECLAKLRKTWNIGDENAAKLAQRARGSLQGIFSQADYPRDALAAEFTGISKIMLLIDEAGAVRDCTILETSGMAVLDFRACGVIIQRAKFTQAVGLDGKPAKDFYRQRINWALKK